jgi:hypothetical protein
MKRSRNRGPGDRRPPRRPTGDYEVGYCKPPQQHQFRKGVSPNPSGGTKKWKTYSTSDVATRSLTQTLSVRKGERVVKMQALAAVYERRLELALKGNLRAINACCQDARMYGLLKDPLITSLANIISPNQLRAMTTKELEFLRGLFEAALSATPQQHDFNAAQKKRVRGFYTVGEEVSAGSYQVSRPETAREALAVVSRIKAAGNNVRIRNKESKEISEDDLRKLAEDEIDHL